MRAPHPRVHAAVLAWATWCDGWVATQRFRRVSWLPPRAHREPSQRGGSGRWLACGLVPGPACVTADHSMLCGERWLRVRFVRVRAGDDQPGDGVDGRGLSGLRIPLEIVCMRSAHRCARYGLIDLPSEHSLGLPSTPFGARAGHATHCRRTGGGRRTLVSVSSVDRDCDQRATEANTAALCITGWPRISWNRRGRGPRQARS